MFTEEGDAMKGEHNQKELFKIDFFIFVRFNLMYFFLQINIFVTT